MAARGTESKESIFNKLFEVYPDAFWEDAGKILRIPQMENGARVEIKVTLTAAKNNLGEEGNAVAPTFNGAKEIPAVTPSPSNYEPTEEEKANVAAMLASLGL